MPKKGTLRKSEKKFYNFVCNRCEEVMGNSLSQEALVKDPKKMFVMAYMYGFFDSAKAQSKINAKATAA